MCKKSLAVKFYTVKPMYKQSQAFILCNIIGGIIFKKITERNVSNRNSLEDGRPAVHVD